MRTRWLALVSLMVVAGCTVEPLDSSASRTRRNPSAGSQSIHESSTDGENAADQGNPNANGAPNAPGSAGHASSEFSLSLLQTTPTVNLGENVDLDVSVIPKGNFDGTVMLSVTGLPDGATASTVQASASAPAKVRISAAYTAVPSAPGASSAITISGTAGTVTATANANFKIAPKVTLTIPVNVDALRAASVQYRDGYGAPFGANQQALRTQDGNGIVVQVFNNDSKQHIIHGNNGFAHGSTAPGNEIRPNAFEMLDGQIRTRTFDPGADVSGYPHDGNNGPGASFRIRVDAAN